MRWEKLLALGKDAGIQPEDEVRFYEESMFDDFTFHSDECDDDCTRTDEHAHWVAF